MRVNVDVGMVDGFDRRMPESFDPRRDLDWMRWLDQEMAVVMPMACGRPLSWCVVALGGVGAMHVDPKIVFRRILQHGGADAFIMFHNHPAQTELEFSALDICLTAQIAVVSKLLNIRFEDHVLVGPRSYLSLRKFEPGWFERYPECSEFMSMWSGRTVSKETMAQVEDMLRERKCVEVFD